MTEINYCSWRLYFGGKELDAFHRKCVQDITVEDILYSSSILTVNFKDPELKFIEDNVLIEDAPVRFVMNYTGTNHTFTFDGFVSAIDMDFGEDLVNLTVYCLDESHKLNRIEKSRSWTEKRSIDVVQEIAREYGLSLNTESGYRNFFVEETISQSNETDIAFCENLAGSEFEKFFCKVRNGVLYYRQYKVGETPRTTLSYRTGNFLVKSFKPQITTEKVKRSLIADVTSSDKSTSKIVSNPPPPPPTPPPSGKGRGNSNKDPNANKAGYRYDPNTRKWVKIVRSSGSGGSPVSLRPSPFAVDMLN